ncbi:unnamed protein product [Blepharisma stoltei]|uniref:WD40 repeat-containing protein n=1 Tax=Blepharisma stoltei TaxID=1481888 RepID=A0AAU9JDJ9_9CILI|nr:unnamed protein product [Blepharisma stoltei]
MAITISSQDINLLILHYLRERGLIHAAFALEKEANITDSPIQPGILVTHLQKSLTLEELEFHANEEDLKAQGFPKCHAEFKLTHSHKCMYREETPKLVPETSLGMMVDDSFEHTSLFGHSKEVLIIHYQNSYILSGSKDRTAKIWRIGENPNQWDLVVTISLTNLEIENFEIKSLYWNKAGDILSVVNDGLARFWTSTGTLVSEISHNTPIICAYFESTGSKFLTVSQDALKIWNSQGNSINSIESCSGIRDAKWHNTDEICTATMTGVFLWKLSRIERIKIEESLNVKKIFWDYEGKFIAMLEDERLGIWEQEGSWWNTIICKQIEWNPNTPLLLVAKGGGVVEIIDPEKRVIKHQFIAETSEIIKIAHSKDGQMFATIGLDGICNVWNYETAEKIKSFSIKQQAIDMVWSDDNTKLAISFTNIITVYNISV